MLVVSSARTVVARVFLLSMIEAVLLPWVNPYQILSVGSIDKIWSMFFLPWSVFKKTNESFDFYHVELYALMLTLKNEWKFRPLHRGIGCFKHPSSLSLSLLSLSHTHTHTHTHTGHWTWRGAGATKGRGGSTDTAHYLLTEVSLHCHESGPEPSI